MPRAGLEPARECPDDFKSSASTIPPPRLLEELGIANMFGVYKGQWGSFIKTSGSMGAPKSVFHSWDAHVWACQAVIQNTNLDNKSISLLSLPMHHIGGFQIWVRSLVSGGRWILASKGWTPIWAAQAGVTHMSLVSTQLLRFMRDAQQIEAMRQMKAILLGGSALPRALIAQAYSEKLPIITTYGSTETCSQVTATCLGDSLEHLYTSGRFLSGRKAEIQDGEICVRAGFVKTGDLGRLRPDGYLEVLGRKDNMMISGGENIYPEEIERVLLENPSIERVLVVSKPDLEYGERPVAFVKSSVNHDFAGWLRERMPGFKIPRDWRPWPSDWDVYSKPPRAVGRMIVRSQK